MKVFAALLCLAIFMSISSTVLGAFAQDMTGDLGGGLVREGEELLPDTNNGDVGTGDKDDTLVPDTTPDNDTTTDGDNNTSGDDNTDGGMDKEDGLPDDDANIDDKDNTADKDNTDDNANDKDDDKKFSYTGLIIALIIAAAVIILIIVMIPSTKRTNGNKNERK